MMAIETHVLRCIIWAPRDESNLVSGSFTTLELVLDIENGISAADTFLALLVFGLCIEQFLAEGAVVWVLRRLFDHNLFPVVADLVDDPLGVFAELKFVEGRNAFRRDGDTGDRNC